MTVYAMAGAALGFLGWAAYLPVLRVPAWRKSMWPVWSLTLLGAALGGGAWLAASERSAALHLAAAAALGECALWALLFFTSMRVPARSGRPAAGQPFPPLAVLSEHGETLHTEAWRGRGPLLLVFFRGFW
ncbi:MAG: hypothetical protein AMXMBFR7_14120 [Planctomycetota bacterium]